MIYYITYLIRKIPTYLTIKINRSVAQREKQQVFIFIISVSLLTLKIAVRFEASKRTNKKMITIVCSITLYVFSNEDLNLGPV